MAARLGYFSNAIFILFAVSVDDMATKSLEGKAKSCLSLNDAATGPSRRVFFSMQLQMLMAH